MTDPHVAPPLVSVAIALRGRAEELAETLAGLRAQRPPLAPGAIEILVVRSHDDPGPTELSSDDEAVRVIAAAAPGLGAARAAALAAAVGPFFAVCDAGDRWEPECLAALLSPFDDARAVLSYATGEPSDGIALARSPGSGTDLPTVLREIPACAVVLRTEAARAAGGYDVSLRAAADLDLWLRLSERGTLRPIAAVVATAAHLRRDEDEALAAEVAHLERLEQRRRDTGRIAARFIERRAGAPIEPFDPTTWEPTPGGRREVIWHSQLRRTKSFGLVGRRLLLAVERQGIAPLLTPFSGDIPADLGRLVAAPSRWNRLAFLYDPLAPPGALRVERLIRYATWETTDVPRWEAAAINRHAALLCVPSRQNRADVLAAGVQVPTVVLPHGVDLAEFPYLDRPAREPYTFGTFGELSPRKGVDVLLRAFRSAFRSGEPVRLLLKGVKREPDPPLPAWAADDPRVIYRGGRVSEDELIAVLGELDVCVLPTRGEAFGLCGLEAMATGLPVIATNWGGPADYLDPRDSLPLGYRLVEAGGIESNDVRYFGRWAEPDEGHLAELLRWCFEQRATAAAMGRAAAARVAAGWTWDHAAVRLHALLDAVAAGVSPG